MPRVTLPLTVILCWSTASAFIGPSSTRVVSSSSTSHVGRETTTWSTTATTTTWPSTSESSSLLLRMAVGDDTGEDEEDHHDDNNPLARGIDSVMWLPSVSGPPSSSRDPLDGNENSNNNKNEEEEDDEHKITTTLPLFPLGSIVYTPNSEHVLNIFEPRYRQMYNDILMNGSKRFVVSMCHPAEDGRFAQVGVLFSLEELKEVSGMTADRVKYICNHRVTGRVRLHKVLNPEAWESRDTYLKVQGTIIDDTGHLAAKKDEDTDDDDNDNDGEVEKKMDEDIAKILVTQMKKAAMAEVHPRTPEEETLAKSFSELVELQHDLSEDVRFTRASVRSFGVADGTDIDPNLWTSIRLWQSYAEQRLVAGQNEMQKEFQERLVDYLRKDMEKKSGGGGEGGGSSGASGASKKSGGDELPSAIGFQDLSPELQSELIDLQKRMTNELRPLMLEQTLSMQKILEAADHEGRVGLMTYFVEAERKRLQAKKMLKSMFSGGVASKESISEARMAESFTSSSPTTTTTQSTTKEEEDSKPQFFADDEAFQ